MEEKVIFAAIAGLLHDIGKFYQSAEVNLVDTANRKVVNDVGFQHTFATQMFVEKFTPTDWQKKVSGTVNHHKPKDQQDYQVQLADRLSLNEPNELEDVLLPRLQSIFSTLSGHNAQKFLKLRRLNSKDKKALFPVSADVKSDVRKDYRDHWSLFEQQCLLRLRNPTTPDLYLENLLNLLLEFTWCIPATAAKGMSEISFYDHARTTAALAACLAADGREPDWCLKAIEKNDAVCFLVGADLSGLQKFIYSITSSGAAKSLRARSFYIQLLEEVLAYTILNRLGLPIVNLLYVGGGGFQLLVPLSVEPVLKEIIGDLTRDILILHQGGLGLAIEWEPLTSSDFCSFNIARDRVGKRLQLAKRKPFGRASTEFLSEVIGAPFHQGGDPTRYCIVTGEDGETVCKTEAGTYKSKFVLGLEELGRVLPKATHLLMMPIDEIVEPSLATSWQRALQVLGFHVEVITSKNEFILPKLKKNHHVRIWNLQSDVNASGLENILDHPAVIGYRPFAQLTPLDAHETPLTFDELSIPITGKFERWGVLRMDVDNLGLLFREGFGKSASISLTANLSLMLRLFFESCLPEFAQGDLQNHLYIQYAGGDDLFVVGSWDALPEFGKNIRQSFYEYTCGNPKLTISGGIALADAGSPIDQIANQAGEAEHQAKSLRPEKNAISFLNQAMDWDSFIISSDEARKIATGIKSNRLPRNLIHAILSLHDQLNEARLEAKRNDTRVPKFGRWTWMAAYQLTRLAESIKEEDKKYLIHLRDSLLKPDAEIETLGLAARWAQYLTRGG